MKIKNTTKTTPAQNTVTDAPKAKGTPAKKAAEAKPEVRSGINIGRTSGMRVMAFQDWTFKVNDQKDKRFTNEELAAIWCREFPESRAVKNGRITPEMVAAVRVIFNSGTNGHGTPGVRQDSQPYVKDAKGQRIKTTVTPRVRKVAEAAPAAPVKKAVVKKVVAKKTATADKTEAA